MERTTIEHPNAVASWVAVRVNRDESKMVLIVETDLILDPGDPRHDAPVLSDLVATVQRYLLDNPFVESADVEPIGAFNSQRA